MAKKVVLIGVAVIVAVIITVLVRTARFSSRQVNVEPAPEVAIDVDAVTGRLSRALQFRTVSYQDPTAFDGREFEGFKDFVAEAYPLVHQSLTLETVNDWSLLYTWQGADPSLNPIILLSHIDVVPVVPGTENDWDEPPFSGTITDEFIYGRGTMDDKMGVLGILEAIEMHLAEGRTPQRTVILSFGHDEEVGGTFGAQVAVELLADRGVEAEFVLDEGGAIVSEAMPGIDAPVATIGVAEKGYLTTKLTVTTDGGHSSQPPRETAIGILSNAIAKLEKNQMPGGIEGLTEDMLQYIGPEMTFGMKAIMANLWLFEPLVEQQLGGTPVMNAFMRTTTAPTMFTAGTKENVLPPSVSAVINFRILPGDTSDDVKAHIARVVGDDRVTVEVLGGMASEPSKVSPSDGPVFDLIAKTVREVAPETVVTPYLVLAGTDSRHFGRLSDHVYRFAPMPIHVDDLKRIHGTNERLAIDGYVTVIRFYHRLIENAALSDMHEFDGD